MGHSGVCLLFQTGNGRLSPQSALAHWPLDPDGILATGPKVMNSRFPYRHSASHWGDIPQQQKAQSKQVSSEEKTGTRWEQTEVDREGPVKTTSLPLPRVPCSVPTQNSKYRMSWSDLSHHPQPILHLTPYTCTSSYLIGG